MATVLLPVVHGHELSHDHFQKFGIPKSSATGGVCVHINSDCALLPCLASLCTTICVVCSNLATAATIAI